MAELTVEQRDYLLPKAFNAALRAGAAILDIYGNGNDYNVDLKSDMTPITEADRRAHEVIKSYLGHTHIPLLSEEGREMLYNERSGWDLFWMVDPLDGTKEFLKGNGEFTVNIALMVDNRPAIGVVYVPYIKRMYFCDNQSGSFLREGVAADADAEYGMADIMPGAIRLGGGCRQLGRPLRIAVSRSHNTPETAAIVASLCEKHPGAEVVEQGSSYKFCMLADGQVDYYARLTNTYEWDTAAGELILEGAGGRTATMDGGARLEYNKESLLNPHFFCRSADCPI